jgi:hypothetical protein
MILRKLVQIDEEGNVEGTFAFTKAQVGTLLNFAVLTLISEGLAEVQEVSTEDLIKEAQAEVLANVNPDDLHQA